MSTHPPDAAGAERRELARWLGPGLMGLLDADARLWACDGLPQQQVDEARRHMAAAIERYETLVQLVSPGTRIVRQAFAGVADEMGAARIELRPRDVPA